MVLGATPTDHPFVRTLRDRELDVVPIDVATRGYLAERAAIASLCRRFRPDVFHTHGYRPDVVDAGVARRLGVPTVTTVHGFTGGGWKDRLYERIQRRAFRSFGAVVAVSQPLRDALLRDGGWPQGNKPEEDLNTLVEVVTDGGLTGVGSSMTSKSLVTAVLADPT